MRLILLGLNHNTTPVEVRERLAVSPGRLRRGAARPARGRGRRRAGPALHLQPAGGVRGGGATAADRRGVGRPGQRRDGLPSRGGAAPGRPGRTSRPDRRRPEALPLRLPRRRGRPPPGARGRRARLTAGGGDQVLGQVKTAFQAAQAAGTAGPVLSALSGEALHAGKRVRTETEIGLGARSLGQVAAALARETLGDLAHRTALIIGAGKMSELAGRSLSEAGLRFLLVSNRTFDKAAGLAASLGGQAVHFDALPQSPGPRPTWSSPPPAPPTSTASRDPVGCHGCRRRPASGGRGPGRAAQCGPRRPRPAGPPPLRHGRPDGCGGHHPPGGGARAGRRRGDRSPRGWGLCGMVAPTAGRTRDHGPPRPGRSRSPGRGGPRPPPPGPAHRRARVRRRGHEPGPGEQAPPLPRLAASRPPATAAPRTSTWTSPPTSSGWTRAETSKDSGTGSGTKRAVPTRKLGACGKLVPGSRRRSYGVVGGSAAPPPRPLSP